MTDFKPGDRIVVTEDAASAINPSHIITRWSAGVLVARFLNGIGSDLWIARFGLVDVWVSPDKIAHLTTPAEDRALAEQAVMDGIPQCSPASFRGKLKAQAEKLQDDYPNHSFSAAIRAARNEDAEHRLKLAASAIVAEWRTNGTADRDELRRNLVAALAEVETPADKFRLLAQKFAEPMVHGGYTRTDTLTFTVDGLERFVAAVFAAQMPTTAEIRDLYADDCSSNSQWRKYPSW